MVPSLFNPIFQITNGLTTVNRSTNREALFRAVVTLNRGRILSRIRSRHAVSWRARGKTPLLQRLRTAKELLRNSSMCSTRAQSLASDVDNLQRQFDRLEDMDSLEARSSRSEEHLQGLVRSIHTFLLQHKQDLKLIPYTPGLWSGNATESLIDRLTKVNQYVKACEELLRLARIYRVFSNIVVEFVDLQQGGRRLSVNAALGTNEIIEASCTREILSRVSSRRRTSISDIRESIKTRLGGTSRLHAEVQLVLYFEQDARLLRPRVISSSKSACYLCHLLLKIHGQYYIPNTHGRLYDTWKWPAPTQLPDTTGRGGGKIDLQRLLPEFSNAITRKIQDCLNNASVVRRVEPLESRVDLLAAMTPSVVSSVLQHSRSIRSGATNYQELEGKVGVAPADNDNIDDGSSSTSARTIRELAPLSRTRPPRADTRMTSPMVGAEDPVSCGGTATPTIRRHASRCSPGSSLPEGSVLDLASHGGRSREVREVQREPLCLRKGEVASHSFDIENGLLHVHVPGLHVDLQYDASLAQGSPLEGQIPQALWKSLQMEVECLSSSISCYENGLAQVVDLEVGNWVEKSAPEGALFSTEGLLLKQRSTLLRLRARLA